ncbi:hypothetical protein [Bartonella queenslandensis]|uniref:hypothetical protein n=1 Tax=Bartonella queenslandensis TaxID=481138 RepID=UPI0002DD60BB|nr:hypothetical protein [Bartonella queenslandensis]
MSHLNLIHKRSAILLPTGMIVLMHVVNTRFMYLGFQDKRKAYFYLPFVIHFAVGLLSMFGISSDYAILINSISETIMLDKLTLSVIGAVFCLVLIIFPLMKKKTLVEHLVFLLVILCLVFLYVYGAVSYFLYYVFGAFAYIGVPLVTLFG